MSRRSKPHEAPQQLAKELEHLFANFDGELAKSDLRPKVKALIPAFHALRDLGSSLIPPTEAKSGRDRILAYLLEYPQTVIDGDELMVVSGIHDWPRRLRELRVQFGWWVYSGVTFKQIAQDNPAEVEGLEQQLPDIDPLSLKPDQYILINTEQDRDAAMRWNLSNDIRKRDLSVKDKIILYLRENVGQEVSGEELRYLANDRSEWARRVRELRTEAGWPVVTRMSGRPDLPVGTYVLEEDRQAEEHDRHIPDDVRVEVLERDQFSCTNCRWRREDLSPEDPRRLLELHHIIHHKDKGSNTAENLVTLCNVCHDKEHRRMKS